MNKGILLTGIVLVLLVLGIFAVSAIVIYSIDNPDPDLNKLNPSVIYTDGYDTSNENPVVINSYSNTYTDTNKNTLCYQGVDQVRGYPCTQEVEQDRTPCTKTVTLSCGKQVTVSCDYSIDQIKGCGHLDVPEQTRGYCYKTITLPCGQTKQVEVSCIDEVPQDRGYPCYPEVDQQRVNCYNKAVKGCGYNNQQGYYQVSDTYLEGQAPVVQSPNVVYS